MTFNTFKDGQNNRFARDVAHQYASERDSDSLLFIYGQSGTGKTHLLNAIGNLIGETHPEKTIVYLTANDLANIVSDALVSNRKIQMLNFFTGLDILLLDDVEEIANKQATQELLAKILDNLLLSGKKVVATCKVHPMFLDGFSERLKSRLVMGTTISLTEPDNELFRDIIESLNKEHNDEFRLKDDIIDIFVKSATSVFHLKGLFNTAIAYSEASDMAVNIETAKKIVESGIKQSNPSE